MTARRLFSDRARQRRWTDPARCPRCGGTGIGYVERDPDTGQTPPAPTCTLCDGAGTIAIEARTA